MRGAKEIENLAKNEDLEEMIPYFVVTGFASLLF
jgi:hypothetical protein